MMHKGAILALSHIEDINIMRDMMMFCDASVFTLLQHVEEEKRQRWLDTYSQLIWEVQHGSSITYTHA